MKIGGGSSHPLGQNGVARPPHFEVRGRSTDRICEVAVMVRVGGILGEDLGEGLVMIGWMFAAVRGDE
jgi:hypothetical protein